MIKKSVVIYILAVFFFLIGIGGGLWYRYYKNSKSVVFRISTDKNMMDYDLLSAINFLEYSFEKNGYYVLPWRYPGNFYHQEGDDAGINVYVRSFNRFYDTRMNKNAINIFYLHRFIDQYAEEMQNYDYYLSSQKKVLSAMKSRADFSYLGAGAVFHELVKADHYDYDVLFIYERAVPSYESYLQNNYRFRKYHGQKFAQMTEDERKDELSKAKLVVYATEYSPYDDEDYIPYAALDIISYGRPVMTKFNQRLRDMVDGHIYFYQDEAEMETATSEAMAIKDEIREGNALKARDKIISFSENVL